MPERTAIEWTESTWNPVTGCTQVSPGCDNCYALRLAERFRGTPNHPYTQGFDLRLWDERLEVPLRWRRPRRVFVNSMSDLFHRDIPVEFIERVFRVMREAHWHTFQVLTKRSRRLLSLAPQLALAPNIWLGVSCESEDYLWRVEQLRQVPSVTRFISAEPLLGPLTALDLRGIDWVITGGESGPNSRPCEVEWVREVRDRCVQGGVAFFHKQWGGVRPSSKGRLLDGIEWAQFPAEPRASVKR